MIDTAMLIESCAGFGVKIGEREAEKLDAFAEFLVQENEKYNLTAIKDPEGIVLKHFADSLTLLAAIEIPEGERIIDVGTGGGFPGIPLLIMRPDIELTMLDSTRKKLNFVAAAVERLELNAAVVHGRAEELGRGELRESFDFAVSRAVAQLNLLCEYCLPFVKTGGAFCAMKGARGVEELEGAARAIEFLGAQTDKVTRIELPEVGERELIIIKKISQTPTKYPRPSAQIAKKPL